MKMMRSVLALVAAIGLLAGCEGGGSSSSSGSSSSGSAVGTWYLTDGLTGETSGWVFASDGTFTVYSDTTLSAAGFSGSYSQSGSTITGTYTNPGVGDGEISGTVNSDGTMSLDFIEHWHDPYKHVPMTGSKQ